MESYNVLLVLRQEFYVINNNVLMWAMGYWLYVALKIMIVKQYAILQ